MPNSYCQPVLSIDRKRVGLAIRKAMRDRGLSYRVVGARTGIDYSHICQISHGSMSSSAETYLTLCKFFRISPWKFVGRRSVAALGDRNKSPTRRVRCMSGRALGNAPPS